LCLSADDGLCKCVQKMLLLLLLLLLICFTRCM
jgi:hypothetical protein